MSLVRLGDIVDSVGGGTPARSRSEFYGGPIPWVTPKDMKVSEIGDSQVRITEAGLASSSARLVPAGSVLVVVRSGVLKHTLPVALTTAPVAINQDLRALLPKPCVLAAYLAHLLRAEAPVILRWVRATTADNFPVARLMNLEVPLPSMDEQRRIVRVLDAASTIRAQRRRSVALAADLGAALYSDLFEPAAGQGLTLGDVADVTSGITKGRRANGRAMTEVPYLAVSNVQAGYLDLTAVKRIAATSAEIERFRLLPGDLLLTEGGDPDKLGRGTLWAGELDPCIHQNHVFRVRVQDPERLDPVFLRAQVSTAPARAYFLRAAKQTTGIASINQTQLRALPIDVPDMRRQRRFVDRLAAARRAEGARRRHLADLDALFTALEHHAFLGVS